MVREIIRNQPSSSRGAGDMWCSTGLEDEALDYDEEKEVEEGEIVNESLGAYLGVGAGQGSEAVVNGRRSFGVLQDLTLKTVQCDQTSDTERQKVAIRSIPRGEKESILEVRGVEDTQTVIRFVSVAVGNSPDISAKSLGKLGGKEISLQVNVEGQRDVWGTHKILDSEKTDVRALRVYWHRGVGAGVRLRGSAPGDDRFSDRSTGCFCPRTRALLPFPADQPFPFKAWRHCATGCSHVDRSPFFLVFATLRSLACR
ncbi:hypothetical protein NDU88_001052 [Pleurodeles waltl]|uniref:Uncharacterized protein n=1 Tax=Pleurodeles waltl TaxID=8319 RepID=A0AAV7SYT9_PLEWA|nr:hypothetical protein NDU88_001052 [Pleurodeles waltl]